MQHVPKQSHYVRWPALELLWHSLCDPLTTKLGDPWSTRTLRPRSNRKCKAVIQKALVKPIGVVFIESRAYTFNWPSSAQRASSKRRAFFLLWFDDWLTHALQSFLCKCTSQRTPARPWRHWTRRRTTTTTAAETHGTIGRACRVPQVTRADPDKDSSSQLLVEVTALRRRDNRAKW